jgi:malic enzyme
MRTVADFLNHHSGLEIAPVPVDASLEDTVAALSPRYAAVCLHHANAEQADAVRDRLRSRQPALPVLDTGDDATAVTVVAALLNAARQAGIPLPGSRVVVVDALTVPETAALLTAAGVRDLTFVDSRVPVAGALGDVPARYDVLIDLSMPDSDDPRWVDDLAPPAISLTVGSVDADAAPRRPGSHRLHPLLALPGLLSASVHRRITVDIGHRLAAAHALARLAGPGHLLPDPLDPHLTTAVHAAVTALP